LAKFKYPELLVLRDGLPTTPNGKIRKDLLRSELNVVSPLPTIAK
jgi:acyl-CoA synthetase (AMP-forming)/AMP-acid ligase II